MSEANAVGVPRAITDDIRGASLWWRDRWRIVLRTAGWECVDEPWWSERVKEREEEGGSTPGRRRGTHSRTVGMHRVPEGESTSRQRSAGVARLGSTLTTVAEGARHQHSGSTGPDVPSSLTIASIPSPIAASVLAEDRPHGPLPPEFFSLRRWYCRALCDDGVWLWIFCADPSHGVQHHVSSSRMWWVHGGWL